MSVNKPGLAKSSQAIVFKKNTIAKTSLSSAYKDGTVANPRSSVSVNLTNMQKGTSVFMSNGAQIYLNPGRALRNVNPNLVKADNSSMRAGLNQNKGYDIAYMKDMQKWWAANQGGGVSNNDGISKYQQAMLGIGMVTQLMKGISDITGSTSQKTNSTNSAGNSDSSSNVDNNSNKSVVSQMKNSNNTATLSAAVDSAKAKKESLPTEIKTAESKLSQLSGQTEGLKQKSETANKDLQANTEAITNKSGQVNEQTNTVSSCQIAFDSAESQYMNSTKNYESAQAAADQCPADDPQKSVLVKNAEIAKNQMDRDKEQLEKTKQNLEQAENKLNQLKNELKELQDQTAGLKETVAKTKEALDQNLSDVKTTQEEIKNLKEEQTTLDTELPKQEARLKELQEKEDKEATGIDKKILNLDGDIKSLLGSIKTTDENGYSSKEQKAKAKADVKQKELDALNARKSELAQIRQMRNYQSEMVGGIQFKTGVSGGKQVYVVSGKVVSQSEYEKAMKKAKGS